jgi:hypothetical protein
MFRSRFTEAFPKSLINFGPQELERDIVDTVPGEGVEHLLCALLGLLLNRKQDVKAGHYNRALEEAISTHKSQWARDWESKNPLAGGATFASMTPSQRLTLLRTLILWSLGSSDVVRVIIAQNYKGGRWEDDLNQPLSVQAWGSDSYKRRYYLIEGQDDTAFRVYRESNPAKLDRTWWSVAEDIEELKALANKLETEDGGQRARTLAMKIMAAIPRFEATEEVRFPCLSLKCATVLNGCQKRKRREYRQLRKQQFKRPEPGFSLYEGRTRGKRIKYTYSDDEDDIYSDATSNRRSTRNTGANTPAEPSGPLITQSGRQVRTRNGDAYGGSSTAANSETGGDDEVLARGGRPRRAAANLRGGSYNSALDTDEDEEEQDYGDDEDDEDDEDAVVSPVDDDDDADEMEEADGDLEEDVAELKEDKKSLVITLPIKTPTPEKTKANPQLSPQKPEGCVDGLDKGQSSPVRQPLAEAEANSPAKAAEDADDDVKHSDVRKESVTLATNSMSPSLAFRAH